jgi:hypothetical protein
MIRRDLLWDPAARPATRKPLPRRDQPRARGQAFAGPFLAT